MSFVSLFSQVSVYPLSVEVIVTLGVTLILLLLSGYMSSSEVAFFSLSPQEIEEVKEEKNETDTVLLRLLCNPERLLATILIGNNLVNVAIVILTAYAFGHLFDFSQAPIVGFVIQTVLLTSLLLLFGEIIPKVYAQRKPLAFSRFSAPGMKVVSRLLRPFSGFLVRSSAAVTGSIPGGQYNISVKDLSDAVSLIGDESQGEKRLLTEIVKFSNKTASDIMVRRIDMVSVDVAWNFHKMLSEALESGYSRIPVFENTEDNIQGILYIKDLIPYKDQDADFEWKKLIRKAYFVPENKRLDDLLEEFRANHIHISIVVDEYGGTSGIITLEDILEEILGDISDEYDEVEPLYKLQPDGSYLFQAKTSINDALRALHLEEGAFGEYEQDVDTLGGLMMEIKQDLVRTGDIVTTEGWKFTATKTDRFRIEELKLMPPAGWSIAKA